MRLTLDKLPGIKSDLAGTDEKWHNWELAALTKGLSRLINCNPERLDPKTSPKKEQLLYVSQRDSKTKVCVIYCSSKRM